MNELPGNSEIAVKGNQIYLGVIGYEALGLTVNVAGDFVESKVLGVDEPVFDDRKDGHIVPSFIRNLPYVGFNGPVWWLPGTGWSAPKGPDQERHLIIDFKW